MSKRPDEEHHLLRPFTEDVALEKGKVIADKLYEIQQLEMQAKAAASKFKEQIEAAKMVALALKDDIRTGKHLVPVQCRWLMSTNTWSLITADGEVIRTEPTTMSDRQGELLS